MRRWRAGISLIAACSQVRTRRPPGRPGPRASRHRRLASFWSADASSSACELLAAGRSNRSDDVASCDGAFPRQPRGRPRAGRPPHPVAAASPASPTRWRGARTELPGGLPATGQAVFSKASTPPSVGSWRRSLWAWSAWTRLAGGGMDGGTCTPGRSGAIASGTITYRMPALSQRRAEPNGEPGLGLCHRSLDPVTRLPGWRSARGAGRPADRSCSRRRRALAAPARREAARSPGSPSQRTSYPLAPGAAAVQPRSCS